MNKKILIALVLIMGAKEPVEAQKGHGRGKAVHVRKFLKHDKKSKDKKNVFVLPHRIKNDSSWS
ncbi:MAG: hypothetical protein NVS1B13_10880 [Flavisolibacter sp.]